MDLRRLRTMVAIADHGGLSRAGRAAGLSHAAVGLHVKELEAELGVALIDRSRRPAALTDRGLALVDHARRMLAIGEEIAALGVAQPMGGTLRLGAAASTLPGLVAPALAALRAAAPALRIGLRSGLSADLALLVRSGELDAALTTAPDAPLPGLVAHAVAQEPLEAVAPADAAPGDARALLAGRPFVWFNRRAWLGQRIEARIAAMEFAPDAAMEVDSLEAVEALVRHGLGASVTPRRGAASRAGLRSAPLDPPAARALVLLERANRTRRRVVEALLGALRAEAARVEPV